MGWDADLAAGSIDVCQHVVLDRRYDEALDHFAVGRRLWFCHLALV